MSDVVESALARMLISESVRRTTIQIAIEHVTRRIVCRALRPERVRRTNADLINIPTKEILHRKHPRIRRSMHLEMLGRRQPPVVFLRIGNQPDTDLAHVRRTFRAVCCGYRTLVCHGPDRGEYRDDHNDDEDFHQREAVSTVRKCRRTRFAAGAFVGSLCVLRKLVHENIFKHGGDAIRAQPWQASQARRSMARG